MASLRSTAKTVEGIEAITNGLTRTILRDNVVNTGPAVATSRTVEGVEAITTSLTRTILEDNVVNTELPVATSARPDNLDAITNRLGQTVLGEDDSQRLAEFPAGQNEPVEKVQVAKLDLAHTPERQTAAKAESGQTTEAEEAIDSLGAACSNCSLGNNEEAEAHREAGRLREQVQEEHADRMKALKDAEARRIENEEFVAFERGLRTEIDGNRLRRMERKARKEKNKENARQLRIAAEVEAIAVAERRAQQQRRTEEDAMKLHKTREADNRARQELSQHYNRIFADSAFVEANARETELQQQRQQAERIAQYREVVARQAHLAELE